MDDITLFLEKPWIKHLAESSYMINLLKYLRIGRRTSSILSKFSDLPERYVLGALEALESLGVVKSLDVSGEKFYVLSSNGKMLLEYVKRMKGSP